MAGFCQQCRSSKTPHFGFAFHLRGRFGHIESPHRDALFNFAPERVRPPTKLGCENTSRVCSAVRRRISSVHGSDSISRISGTKKPPVISWTAWTHSFRYTRDGVCRDSAQEANSL